MKLVRFERFLRFAGIGKLVKTVKKQDAFILPLILIISFVIGLLVMSVISLGYSDNRNSTYQHESTQAYYLARSGADTMSHYLMAQVKIQSKDQFSAFVTALCNQTSSKTYLTNGDIGYFEVSLTQNGTYIYINSVGTYNTATKKVVLVLNQTLYNIFVSMSDGLYVDSSLKFSGSTSVRGNVNSNFTNASQLSFDSSGGQYISGNVITTNASLTKSSFNQGTTKIQGSVGSKAAADTYPMPAFPTYPGASELKVYGNKTAGWNPSPPYYLDAVQAGYKGAWYQGGIDVLSELIIPVGNTDFILRTKYFKVSGAGTVKLNKTGTGKLIIYIDDTDSSALTMANGATINYQHSDGSMGDDGDMQIYFNTTQLTIDGSVKLRSLLYGLNTIMTINGSGTVLGHIITGANQINLNGDASANVQAIFAPNAACYLNGSGKIKGVVVAKTCELAGGSWIEFASLAQDANIAYIFGKPDLGIDYWSE